MALELKLSTAKAVKALRDFDSALKKTEAAMNSFNANSKKMAASANTLNGSFNQAGAASKQFAAAHKQTNATLSKTVTATQRSSKSFVSLGAVMRTVTGTMAGLGVAIGAIQFGRAIKGTYELHNAFQRINILFNSATNSATGGAEAIKFLKDTARATAISIDALAQSYSTFGYNAIQAGLSVKQTNDTFSTLAMTMRVLNLSTEQAKRTFKGFEQVINKGTFSMEEIRQQIGENVPALKALEKAANMTGIELQKAMKNGAIGIEYLQPLMKEFIRQYAQLLPEAMKTTAAGFDRINNELTFLAQNFASPFWDALAPHLHKLADALEAVEKSSKDTMEAWGKMAGEFVGKLIDGLTYLVQNADSVAYAFQVLGDVILALLAINFAQRIYAFGQALMQFGQFAMQASVHLARLTMVSQATGGIMSMTTAFRMLGTVLTGMVLPALGYFLVTIGLLAAAYAAWMVVSGQVDQLMKEIGAVVYWVGEQLGYTHEEVKQGIAGWLDWASAIKDNVVAAMDVAIQVFNDVMQVINGLVKKLMDAAKALGGQFVAAWNKAKSIVSSAASSIGSAIQSIINWVNKAIAALKRLLGLQKEASSGSKGGGSKASSARRGGISHKMGAHPKVNVPAGAWANAPHFKDGGVTGGGIPAVLHKNEAVIPLKGGAVPVELSATGNSSPQTARQGAELLNASETTATSTKKMVDLIADVDDKLGRMGESFTGRLDKIAAQVNANSAAISSSMAGGASGFGGGSGGFGGGGFGGGGFGGSGGYGTGGASYSLSDSSGGNSLSGSISSSNRYYNAITGQADPNAPKMVESGIFAGIPEDLAKWAAKNIEDNFLIQAWWDFDWDNYKKLMYPYGMYPIFQNQGQEMMYANYKASELAWQERDLYAWLTYVKTGGWPMTAKYQKFFDYIGQNAQSLVGKAPGMMSDMLGLGEYGLTGSTNKGFAKGTPNTSQEKLARAGSGRMAMVHGNEAIIPLTSGQKVPVQLPQRAVQAMEGGMAAAGSNNGGVTINMNVNAKDVDSFRRSKRQLMQELSQELRNVEREIGKPGDTDLTRTRNTIDTKGD